jgi:predicted DNA-binding transcriptional regulator AlpA
VIPDKLLNASPAIPKLLSVPQVSEITGLKESSILDPRIRQKLQLPMVRLGKRCLFRDCDVAALIERSVVMPLPMPADEVEGGVDVAD